MPLVTTPNLPRPDDLYAALIALHEGKTPEESLRIAARLILLLGNHIGDPAVVSHAIRVAAEPGATD
jgi:hypothetical protein